LSKKPDQSHNFFQNPNLILSNGLTHASVHTYTYSLLQYRQDVKIFLKNLLFFFPGFFIRLIRAKCSKCHSKSRFTTPEIKGPRLDIGCEFAREGIDRLLYCHSCTGRNPKPTHSKLPAKRCFSLLPFLPLVLSGTRFTCTYVQIASLCMN